MKGKNRIIAAVDIGSHALRMKIVQVNKNGETKILETLRQPVSLGKDTFAMGKVSFETVDVTCEILQGFKRLMTEYHIDEYRAVATSALREAQNKDYIVDQIKLKTDLDIDVIDTSEERFLIYKPIRKLIQKDKRLKEEGVMIVDIGSGSMQVSIYSQDCLTFSQNIKLGSLRIREVLSSIEGRTLYFSKILEEYIAGNIDRLKIFQSQDFFKYFIAIGGEINVISKLCNRTNDYQNLKQIDKLKFEQLYEELLYKSSHAVAKDYGISLETADILLPSMMIFKKFLDMTVAQKIEVPFISLTDGLIVDMIDQRYHPKDQEAVVQDILSSARFLAKRYRYDQAHAESVEQKSLALFDALKKLHGLGQRERLLLQLAAILHDTGKFISLNQHYVYSYEIIMASDLIGIPRNELEMVANVARYHSRVVPISQHQNFSKLNERQRVAVAKLVAIIRLADALDRSHKQKIKGLRVNICEKEVVITIETIEDVLLEEWTFENKADFFQEVFGITPVLKTKRRV